MILKDTKLLLRFWFKSQLFIKNKKIAFRIFKNKFPLMKNVNNGKKKLTEQQKGKIFKKYI
jgi:hypothetical protein